MKNIESSRMQQIKCNTNCSNCSADLESHDFSADRAEEDRFSGIVAAFMSLLVFVLPLLFALIGTLIASHGVYKQLGGGILGFFTGVIIASFATRCIVRPKKEKR